MTDYFFLYEDQYVQKLYENKTRVSGEAKCTVFSEGGETYKWWGGGGWEVCD